MKFTKTESFLLFLVASSLLEVTLSFSPVKKLLRPEALQQGEDHRRYLNTGDENVVDQSMIDRAVAKNKNYGDLTFAYLSPESQNDAVVDDIIRDLGALGFTVKAKPMAKSDLNDLRQAGDFHITMTETWGTPYDPYTTAASWDGDAGGEGWHNAFANFTQGNSREVLYQMIKDALKLERPTELQAAWLDIHKYYHAQAVMNPLWGKRVPTILNKRFSKWQAGYQQFDYPVWKLEVVSGSTTATISPGARTGLFETVGPLEAHTYGPNEFFSSNWVYEGLVAYGPGGQIIGALAESWDVPQENSLGGYTYTYHLRHNVTFHDGAQWNCTVAKMNFDHLFAGALKSYHGWYGVFLYTEDWTCNNEYEFVIRTKEKHGPYEQELTLIRPVRFISPNAFPADGSDPLGNNACSLHWGQIEGDDVLEGVNCVGLGGYISGTGPYKLKSRDCVGNSNPDPSCGVGSDGEPVDNRVTFEAHNDYWDGRPGIQELIIVRYEDEQSVKAALLNQELDMVWGAGVLSDASIVDIRNSAAHSQFLNVFLGPDILNVILLLNSGKPPLDDFNVRKTIIHAINKEFVETKLQGLQEPVDNVFPRLAPYCDVDLTPRWDYDFEKAVLLTLEDELNNNNGSSDDNKALAIGLGVGLGVGILLMALVAVYFYNRTSHLQEQLDLKAKKDTEGSTKDFS